MSQHKKVIYTKRKFNLVWLKIIIKIEIETCMDQAILEKTSIGREWGVLEDIWSYWANNYWLRFMTTSDGT